MLQNSQLKSIFDMGLQLFRKQIETSPATERTLSSGLVEMITQERRGDHGVDRKVLKSLVKMLLLLGLYSKHFEEEFLQETQRFYQTEGFEKMRELQVLDYKIIEWLTMRIFGWVGFSYEIIIKRTQLLFRFVPGT